MKISELMTKDVRTLAPDTPVSQAVALLVELKISGLPVVDASRKLVGIFTEKDVLKAVLPSYVAQVGPFVYENSPQTIKNKVAKVALTRVGDLMQRDVVKAGVATSVSEVARIMVTQNVRRVPVVDGDGKIAGIVSRSDVLRHLLT
ncbi:MAG: HPP family protein [Deltaproteobacteria bacterium]